MANSEPIMIKGLDGQDRHMSLISQKIAEKMRVARMDAPQVSAFVESSKDVDEQRARMRLIASMEKERPFKKNQSNVDRIRYEGRVDHTHKLKGSNSLFEASRPRPDAVGRFLRRLREALHARVASSLDKEARVLSLALARGTDPTDGCVDATSLVVAMHTVGVQLSASTAEEVVAFVAALATGSDGGGGSLRMSAKKFASVVLDDSHASGIGSILRQPDSTQAAIDREAASHKLQAVSKKHMGAIDWAPASSRSDPPRPPLVDAFVAEVAAAIERENTKTRLEASASAATATNMLRLLGGFADRKVGPYFNRHGIGPLGLARAMEKLGLDLPLDRASLIVGYYAGVAQAEVGQYPDRATWPAQGSAVVGLNEKVDHVGGGASVVGCDSKGGGQTSTRSALVMPLDRLVAEVAHGKPSVLAVLDKKWGGGGIGSSPSLPSSPSPPSAFRKGTVLPPRRDVEELKYAVLSRAKEVALTGGGTPGSVLRVALVDCSEQKRGLVDAASLHHALKTKLGCGGRSGGGNSSGASTAVCLASCRAAVEYFAELHRERAKDLVRARKSEGGGGGSGSGSGMVTSSAKSALALPHGWCPIEVLIEGLGAITKLSNHNRNVGPFSFLAQQRNNINNKVVVARTSGGGVPGGGGGVLGSGRGFGSGGGGGGSGIGDEGGGGESYGPESWSSTSLEASRAVATAWSASSPSLSSARPSSSVSVKPKQPNPHRAPSSSSTHVRAPAEVQVALGRVAVAAINTGLKQARTPLDVLEGLCVRHAMTTTTTAAASSSSPPGVKTTTWLSRRRLARVLTDLNAASGSAAAAAAASASASAASGVDGGGGSGARRGIEPELTVGLSKAHAENLFSWYASLVGDTTSGGGDGRSNDGPESSKANGSDKGSSSSSVAVDYKRLIKDAAAVLATSSTHQGQQQKQQQKQQQQKQSGGLPSSLASGNNEEGRLPLSPVHTPVLTSKSRQPSLSRPRTAPMSNRSGFGGGGGVSARGGLTSARAHLTRKIEERVAIGKSRSATVEGIQQVLPMGLTSVLAPAPAPLALKSSRPVSAVSLRSVRREERGDNDNRPVKSTILVVHNGGARTATDRRVTSLS